MPIIFALADHVSQENAFAEMVELKDLEENNVTSEMQLLNVASIVSGLPDLAMMVICALLVIPAWEISPAKEITNVPPPLNVKPFLVIQVLEIVHLILLPMELPVVIPHTISAINDVKQEFVRL